MIWEQIRANQRRSVTFLALIALLLAAMGYAFGVLFLGPRFGPAGVAVALVIFLIQLMVYWFAAESVLMAGLGARELSRDESPRLFNIVEEMKLASGLEYMPRIYLLDEMTPNAFAISKSGTDGAVGVTAGLMHRLSRDELQGVIAHEVAHLKNRDSQFMTLAGVMLGSIIMLSEMTWRMLRYGGRGSSRSSSRSSGGGGGHIAIIILAVAVMIIGPIVARLLYMATSRKREFLADACSAQYTRYPDGLATALEKIWGAGKGLQHVSKAIAPMFIVNPLYTSDDEPESMFSTHPPTSARIKILRSMAGAGFADYAAAYRSARKGVIFGSRTMAAAASAPKREASTEGPIESRQEASTVVHRLYGFIEVNCECGLKMNVPEMFEHDEVICIRCGRKNPLPAAKERFARYLEKAKPKEDASQQAPLTYERKSSGWETFRCSCGGTVQLSPQFAAPRTQCPRCKRRIEVVTGAGAAVG